MGGLHDRISEQGIGERRRMELRSLDQHRNGRPRRRAKISAPHAAAIRPAGIADFGVRPRIRVNGHFGSLVT
jgi:hypothetical protein